MNKIFPIFVIFIFSVILFSSKIFAFSADEYLVDLGKSYYNSRYFEEASREFHKALLANPSNQDAQKYLAAIKSAQTKELMASMMQKKQNSRELRQYEQTSTAVLTEPVHKKSPASTGKTISADDISTAEPVVNKPKSFVEKNNRSIDLPKTESTPIKTDSFDALPALPSNAVVSTADKTNKSKFSGEVVMGAGITDSGDKFIWKRANWDLHEFKDWRVIDSSALNNRFNTYDPAIYDRLKVVYDSHQDSGFGLRINMTADPWSYYGNSSKVTLWNAGHTQSVDVQLKMLGSNGYTVNENIYDSRGFSVVLDEMKVHSGNRVDSAVLTSFWGANYTMPELKISREFWPMREMMFNFKSDTLNFNIFPLAYQDKALTSDDPLQLSNHHIFWEESPWLDAWRPGVRNSVNNFCLPGEFDDQLSWLIRDSDGQRLTFLRGGTIEFTPTEDSNIAMTVAAPKTLWQDYDEANSAAGAIRGKIRLNNQLMIGFVDTAKLGFNDQKIDAANYAHGVDAAIAPIAGTKIALEAAVSNNKIDKTTNFSQRERGNAFTVTVTANTLKDDILTSSYEDIRLKPKLEEESNTESFSKARLMLTHFDKGFNPGLSNYIETRKDQFWSRHLHFREPMSSYYLGTSQSLTWDDIQPSAIGDSIDRGRDIIALRAEGVNWFNGKVDELFDVRNAHNVNGKFIENEARSETTLRLIPKLTAKVLGIYQAVPKTTEGIDPYACSSSTGEYLENDSIKNGKNADVVTASLGLDYEFTKWYEMYGIWEHTNDYTLGYDNFPRGSFNDKYSAVVNRYGTNYGYYKGFLYNNSFFHTAPYEYYDIWKTGIIFRPSDKIKTYLDFTRNEYRFAGQIDDNINHYGLEIDYAPYSKLELYFKYTLSQWKDINRIIAGENPQFDFHHNFAGELRLNLNNYDNLSLMYGVTSRGAASEFLYDPYGGTLPTLDTQHIVRLSYRRKF